MIPTLKDEIKNVHHKSLSYSAIQLFVKPFFHLYFNKYKINGYDKNFRNMPIIYIINHQSTFVDALTMVFHDFGRQNVFIARADVFKKKMARRFLLTVKILPIFREHDGVDVSIENQVISNQCEKIIFDNKSFGIYPEGTHHGKLYLRKLKKGFARMALDMAEKSNYEKEIYIVPVGLNYSNLYEGNSDILVNYGKPILLSDYFDLSAENKAKAILKLTNDSFEHLKKLMVHVEDNTNYEFYDAIRKFATAEKINQLNLKYDALENEFISQNEVLKKAHQYFSENENKKEFLEPIISKYFQINERYKLNFQLFDEYSKKPSFVELSLLLFLLSPFVLISWLHYFLPSIFIRKQVKKIFKDKLFHQAGKFALGVIFMPVFILLLAAMLLVVGFKLKFVLLYILIQPFWFKFHRRFENYRQLWNDYRNNAVFKKKNLKEYNEFMALKLAIRNVLKEGKII